MKRASILILGLLALCGPTVAQFTPNEIRIQQRDAANTSFFSRIVLPTVTDGILIYNASTQLPHLVTLGSNLSIIGGVLDAAGGGAPTSGQIISALGYTPYNASNPSGYLSSISGAQVTSALGFTPYSATNPLGFISGITGAQVSTALGFTPYDTSNPAGFVTGSALTSTLGGYATTSALSTGLAGKFSTPTGTIGQYLRGDGSVAAFPAVGTGSVTSITAGTGLAGGTITTTGTISLPTVATPGSYTNVTVDAQGRVTSGTARSTTFLTRALNTCALVSATRDADVLYNVEITASAALIGGQRGTAYLETFTDGACTLGAQEVMRSTNGNTSALIVAVGNVSNTTLTLQGPVSAGLYLKIRTENNTGTPTFVARPGWERLN